ncbi:response regulator [Chitinophaga sp. SYP-B3965]|uniref:hybrid sensor histidine kinase/response regulator transcription factor n=1 Tax=Chitinophaga sp. SYP-B3965 TaxID=2663120 RepID=UPI001299F6DF|nr:two-component regulator propeller domain-containing protein [Chitinophaga sp. SYP-B3965]MRG48417.1 response regulator [Chitinophaga sp. SYP-B3965]
MLKKFFLVPLLLSLLQVTYAQQEPVQFSTLNIHNGLSSNQVNCIYKDTKGFLWFGTMSGLNRYDGNNFRIFRHSLSDSLSLNDDYITHIFPAPGNCLFIKTRNGDNIYDPVKEQFTNAAGWLRNLGMPSLGANSMLRAGNVCWVAYTDSGLYRITDQNRGVRIILPKEKAGIADIKMDGEHFLYILFLNGSISKMDTRTNKIVHRTDALCALVKPSPFALQLFIDAQHELWVYTPNTDYGVLYFNPVSGVAKQLSRKQRILNNDIVNSVIQDNHGLIWIGTDHGGINIIDKKDFSSRFLTNQQEDVKSVAEDAIYPLYKDNQGIIWCGTYKRGISYYAENKMKFSLYKNKQGNPQSLSYNDVNCFVEDRKGNLWIGTNGGGLLYFDRKANTFRQFKHNAADDNSISNDVIVSLYIDAYNSLWIGYYFGGMDYYSNNRFTHFRHNPEDPNSLSSKTVLKIFRDQRNNFWVGTLGGGLDRFDPGNGIFYHNSTKLPNSIHSDFVSAFAESKDGDLWIGTAYGIDVMDKEKGTFSQLLNRTHNLSNDNVTSLHCDSWGNMWAGTREGLNVYNAKTGTFKSFRIEDGLPDNNINCILEDNNHQLWVSTSNGLSRVTIEQDHNGIRIHCRNYDEDDGLQGRAFNASAALKLRSGELMFGGADGFNIFNPADVRQNRFEPILVFTGLQILNKPVAVNEKRQQHVMLPTALPETREITLRYNENDFSIDFAALNFINTRKNRYAYSLEGFNKDWVTTDGKTRRISYTNINPGEYTLHLKAANEDGVWNEEGISLRIIILPPFWKTIWAYGLYLLLGAGLLFFSRKMIIQRAHRRFALQQERREAQRLHDLDMMKIKLLTNVSHEFRTPVSLILAPIEEIIKQTKDPDDKQKFQLIRRNARRLLNLVNQLMDFRKMEMKELKTEPVAGDLMAFIHETVDSFTDLAERKGVAFAYHTNCTQLQALFDHDKMERILFNLLSNAFKFTPEGGSVTVTANVQGLALELQIKDTGIGIPEERQEKIFERYFQLDTPGQFVHQGSGIGLAISREFVRLCNGSIAVESKVDEGTLFTLRFPIVLSQTELPVAQPAGPEKRKLRKNQRILIVEDNDDFRFYLKDNLKEWYDILEATDGADGWQKILSALPDLVVSDVNMPLMDGVDLCKKIGGDARTRHIPVILLTAMDTEETQLKGLESGAVDYMVKPFNFEIMLSRVRNILARQVPVQLVIPQPNMQNANTMTADDKFMQRVLEIVEKHLSEASFSVEMLSRQLCMNRVSVYRRIFSLTGHSPIEFIRTVRLQRAAQLLTQTEMNITEVAYEVGFNNPKYFARYFKMAYNMLPSAYASVMRK